MFAGFTPSRMYILYYEITLNNIERVLLRYVHLAEQAARDGEYANDPV